MISFSIIVPTYNAEKTISIALDSILTQVYQNFEILVIDGASNDNTSVIVNKFQSDKIRFISEKDKGVYDAMNKGIINSKGNWLYFLGSDDRLYDNNVLDNMATFIKRTSPDVVYGDVYSSRFNGRYDGEFNNVKIQKKNICHQSIFFNRKIFNSTGLFDLRYKIYADWDHNLNWFLNPNIKKVYYDIIIAEYADGGLSSKGTDKVFNSEKSFKIFIYNSNSHSIIYRLKRVVNELRMNYNNYSYIKMILSSIPRLFFNA